MRTREQGRSTALFLPRSRRPRPLYFHTCEIQLFWKVNFLVPDRRAQKLLSHKFLHKTGTCEAFKPDQSGRKYDIISQHHLLIRLHRYLVLMLFFPVVLERTIFKRCAMSHFAYFPPGAVIPRRWCSGKFVYTLQIDFTAWGRIFSYWTPTLNANIKSYQTNSSHHSDKILIPVLKWFT